MNCKVKTGFRNYWLSLALLLLLPSIHISLFSQETHPSNESKELEKNVYDITLLQLENLLLKEGFTDSIFIELLADAKSLANQEEWKEGTEILNTLMELYAPLSSNNEYDYDFIKPDAGNERFLDDYNILEIPEINTAPRLQIEAGVDYSLHEFELSLFESDSLLVEELQNPYISISYFQPFNFGKQQSFQLNHRLRLDNQYFNYALFGTWEKNDEGFNTRFEFDGNYFHSQLVSESHFLDSQMLLSFGNANNLKNRWHIRMRSRYKGNLQPDSLNRNIFSANLNAYFEHFFNHTHSFYINLTPNIYRETTNPGYRYFQNRVGGRYRVWGSYNRLFNLGMEAIYQDFRDDISGEQYQNRYFSITPRMDAEWAFASWFGYEVRLSWENRAYETADAISPNYSYLNILAIQKFYFGDLKSIGIGYAGEQQRHSVDRTTDLALAAQADFESNGLVVVAEYLNLKGAILNLEYRTNWRTYPNAQTSIFDSFYSDRLVHSISLFGWIPITENWQIQLFANYDNDQDRNNDRNDNRNTLVNLGLIYKF